VRPGRPARPPVSPEGPELDVVETWFQAVITHPGGVAAGLGSEEAQRRLPVAPAELGTVVAPSRNLTAEERLGIYAHAYYARLLECLADCFPLLARALGPEVFESFAFEYLQRYPSRSYTLDRLGEDFPRFLEETRPEGDPLDPASPATGETPDTPSWPDFLIDLARLEWAIAKVFDGPGVEGQPLLRPEDLEALGPERFAAARLRPVVCLRLLAFRYPVNAYYTAARRAIHVEEAGEVVEDVPLPEPAPEHVALTRVDFVVRRHDLTPFQYNLLQALAAGARVADAIAEAVEAPVVAADLPEEDLAAAIRESFRLFAAQGFFQAIR
jgi:hypothetical protein